MTAITIGIPVYNGMPYLPDAVESILRQTHQDFRLVIINDGSTDGSADYLDSIKDRRVVVIHQENRGLGATLNRSLDMCDTEFYARMDADDVCHPERLHTQLRLMETHPKVVLCSTQVSFFSGSRHFPGPRSPLIHDGIKSNLFRGIYSLCHGAAMVRTKTACLIGGYRISRSGQDFDFFLRMGEAGHLANTMEVLYYIRLQTSSINMTAQCEVAKGRAFALHCAECRSKVVAEPSFAEFCQKWRSQGICDRFTSLVDNWSRVNYRQALIDLAKRKTLLGYTRLASSAVCRPKATLRRIWQKVMS